MGMTVQRRKDSKLPHVLMHKIADIRGGVSVKTEELGGDFMYEGTVLSAPVNGICHVIKIGQVIEKVEEGGTEIKVKKAHNFKVGDFVMSNEGAKAYAITKIDTTNKDYDAITIGTAIGVIEKGAQIVEAKGESADTSSSLKYTPLSIAGTGKPVQPGQNIDTDAWVIGVTKGNPLPECVAKYLTGIVNY